MVSCSIFMLLKGLCSCCLSFLLLHPWQSLTFLLSPEFCLFQAVRVGTVQCVDFSAWLFWLSDTHLGFPHGFLCFDGSSHFHHPLFHGLDGPRFIYPLIYQIHVAFFQISGIRVKAAVNIPVQVFPRTYVFHSFGQILSTMTIESCSKSMAVFVRSRQTVI